MTEPSTTQRDELARELFIADNSNQPREASLVDWEWFESAGMQRGQIEHYKNMAAGMIAAGYRKPRTITTVEDAAESIVTKHLSHLSKRDDWAEDDTAIGGQAAHIVRLLKESGLLHEPEAEATR